MKGSPSAAMLLARSKPCGMSDPERGLLTILQWSHYPQPVSELVFAPPRKWRFDFAWPDRMLAVEVEGGSWVNGAHTRGRHFESDMTKYNEAAILGWRVLRFTPAMIEDGRALATLERVLE